MITFTVLLVVSILGIGLISLLNRKTTRQIKNARLLLQESASTLEPGNIDEFINRVGIQEEDKPAAIMLLKALAEILKVKPNKLTQDYEMHSLLVCSRNTENEHENIVEIDPFSLELIENIAMMSDKKRWDRKWNTEVDLPRNENDLANLILRMTLGEFLKFFSPLIKVK